MTNYAALTAAAKIIRDAHVDVTRDERIPSSLRVEIGYSLCNAHAQILGYPLIKDGGLVRKGDPARLILASRAAS